MQNVTSEGQIDTQTEIEKLRIPSVKFYNIDYRLL